MIKTANQNEFIQDFTTGRVSRQLFAFSTPFFLSGLLQVLYSMVDMIVVGQVVGKLGLSAVAIGDEVLSIMTFVAFGFSSAAQVLTAGYVGAGRRDLVNKMIGTQFVFMPLCAVFMMTLGLCLHNQFLTWLNTPPDVFSYARGYYIVCTLGLPFIYGYNAVSAMLRGMGDSKHPLLFVLIASVVNVVLDILFVRFFLWGPMGAALATVLGQFSSFLFSLLFLIHRRESFGFDFQRASFRIDRQALAALVRLGVPMTIKSAGIGFSKLFVSAWINSYGVVAVALTGIGNRLQNISIVLANALATAGSSMIAQCLSVGKFKRVSKIIRISFLLDAIPATILAAVTVLFPRAVFGIFTDDPAVLVMSASYLPVFLLLLLGSMLRAPMNALIAGSGNSSLNLVVALLDGIVARIGFALLLGLVLHMGVHGFWYGSALAGFVPFLVGITYYFSGRWKRKTILS